jgi:hypothetical protein
VLKERKIFYFSSEEDSKPDADGKTWHKGYIDLVGCTVEAFEDSGSDLSVYYGFLVTEEAPHPTDPTPPLRLCSAHEHQRDEWIETIKMASRPTWIDNKDPRAAVCMVSGVKFGLKTRKSHCRYVCGTAAAWLPSSAALRSIWRGWCACVVGVVSRSGGVMCKAETVLMELPNMGYTEPQKCCTLCQQGAAASRTCTHSHTIDALLSACAAGWRADACCIWPGLCLPDAGYVNKEPRAARSNVKPKAMDAAADAGKKAFGAAAGFFKSKKKDKK